MAGPVKIDQQRKLAAMQIDPQLGAPRYVVTGANGLMPPSARPIILNDIHAAHAAYIASRARTGDYVPHVLSREAVDKLLGVEGFLSLGRHASYNTPPDAKYTGVFQFGTAAFHGYAGQIATRLNDMMPDLQGTTLPEIIKANNITLPLTKDNVWALHRHPIAQMVGAAIHTSPYHKGIDDLAKKGAVTTDESHALFVISHNIPRLAKLMIESIKQGQDVSVQAAPIKEMAPLMKTNPALYSNMESLRGILDKVSNYAKQKGDAVERIGNGGPPAQKPTGQVRDYGELSAFVTKLLEEEKMKRDISEHDRKILNEMIREIQSNPIDQGAPERAPAAPVQIVGVPPARLTALPKPLARSTQQAAVAKAKVAEKHQPVDDAYRPPAGTKSFLNPPDKPLTTRGNTGLTAADADAQERAVVERAKKQPPAPPKGRPIVTHST